MDFKTGDLVVVTRGDYRITKKGSLGYVTNIPTYFDKEVEIYFFHIKGRGYINGTKFHIRRSCVELVPQLLLQGLIDHG